LALGVVAVICLGSSLYYHTVNKDCLVEEVVRAGSQHWSKIDSDKGVEPYQTDLVLDTFAEKLSELSPGALLYLVSQRKTVGTTV
jgi:hypothetical protein